MLIEDFVQKSLTGTSEIRLIVEGEVIKRHIVEGAVSIDFVMEF
jgi:hypothetical protein